MEPCESACFTMPQFYLQCEFRERMYAPCFPSLWYNSEHKPLCFSNSTVMTSRQKCLTRSQNKALQYVSLLRVHKILCMQLYRIVNSNRCFPDWNCPHGRMLMDFKGLIPLLCLKFQRLKKMLPVMKLVCIYQTHILHSSINMGVTAGEVCHSEKVSSFIN